jgi:hypothetical protein
MSRDDRRASLRRQQQLPFAWCRTDAEPALAEVCRKLALPAANTVRERLAALDEDLERACDALTEPRVAAAVRLLAARLDLLEEAVLGEAPVPAAQWVELSADGLGFDTPARLEPGDWLGVHLVLPPAYHLVARVRVSHCTGTRSRCRVGARFIDLSPSAARRLTRYVIGREDDAAADGSAPARG